jgi:hypothetical protein
VLASKFNNPTDDQNISPSLDCSCRFALDKLLRDNGFIIHRRSRYRKESIWLHVKKKKFYSQHIALRMLPKDKVEDAKYAEALYLEEKYGG